MTDSNSDTVKFGWRVPAFSVDGSNGAVFIEQISHTLELIQGRFDSAWVADHFVPWSDVVPVETDSLEGWTAISYLSAAYPQLDFGNIVLCQSYRNPALLAKMASTLQLMTGGRIILGIGAGWKDDEYLAYGYDFPRPAVRIRQLDETVQIIRRMWTESPATFQGKYYRIENAYCEPKPHPPIPIMIGGSGEKLTLRVVARRADWWNHSQGGPADFAHKLEVLKGHCQAVGRDPATIVKTWGGVIAIGKTESEAKHLAEASPFRAMMSVAGTPDQVADYLREYTDMGVTHFILRFADFPQTDGIELFAERVLPQFR